MPDVLLELPDGDVTPLLPHLDDAVFANLVPGVDEEDVPSRSLLGQIFGNSGPHVPFATWTPGEIGLQHATGPRVVRTLEERGVAVPEEWYVVSDHPKRGVVLRTYAAPVEDVLRWLVRAATVLCPLPITGPWQAQVRTR